MAAVFEKIVDAFKTAISDLEKIVKDIVSEAEKISIEAGQKIEALCRSLASDLKAKISSVIQTFRARIQTFRNLHSNPAVKPGVLTFGARIEKAGRNALKDVEEVLSRFKQDAKEALSLARDAIRDVKNAVISFSKDATTTVEKSIKDIANALRTVGSDILNSMKHVEKDVVKELELDKNFVFKHGLQISEVAAVAILPPVAIAAFIGSGLIIGGAIYI